MDFITIRQSIRSDPVVYGKWVALFLSCIIVYVIHPGPLFAYLAGFVAGHGYAESVYHFYYKENQYLKKIAFVQYACFGVFTATGLSLSKLYEDGTLQWYVISSFMISSSITLGRLVKREYEIDAQNARV